MEQYLSRYCSLSFRSFMIFWNQNNQLVYIVNSLIFLISSQLLIESIVARGNDICYSPLPRSLRLCAVLAIWFGLAQIFSPFPALRFLYRFITGLVCASMHSLSCELLPVCKFCYKSRNAHLVLPWVIVCTPENPSCNQLYRFCHNDRNQYHMTWL